MLADDLVNIKHSANDPASFRAAECYEAIHFNLTPKTIARLQTQTEVDFECLLNVLNFTKNVWVELPYTEKAMLLNSVKMKSQRLGLLFCDDEENTITSIKSVWSAQSKGELIYSGFYDLVIVRKPSELSENLIPLSKYVDNVPPYLMLGVDKVSAEVMQQMSRVDPLFDIKDMIKLSVIDHLNLTIAVYKLLSDILAGNQLVEAVNIEKLGKARLKRGLITMSYYNV